ncbi:ChuX/HutX family heme-like substrate-binding protein [Anthocerotibacter panamensis]|uniref:ChuX/HutX family heme-like substrate-binding protein n=1 Tax=Anthocerotibacter panamensis TaxID=2857077 RepID=UPI001C403172|nr:ChuX/HutX family heme-like substrate-binding protein [Anthocerotibacter panamensis]
MSKTLKDFLADCESLGTLRIIVTNNTAVLEARGRMENLFYVPRVPTYANMHNDHFEFHLNMADIQRVKFEELPAKQGNFTTYCIRLFKPEAEKASLSLFLQWGKPGAYEPGQVEAFIRLRETYGAEWFPIWEVLPEPIPAGGH